MTNLRIARWAVIEISMQQKLSHPDHPIAVVEALAIVLGIFRVIATTPQFQSRSAIWYCDNVNAIATMVKGNSGCKELDILAMSSHLAASILGVRFWWE